MPSNIDFKALKHIDKYTEYTVYGFIRRYQRTIGSFTYHIIPTLVYQICLAFYGFVDEWNVNKVGNGVVLKNKTASNNSNGRWRSVYGVTICKYPNTYIWRMKIETLELRKEIMIGIADKNTNYQNNDIARHDVFLFWSWNCGTCLYRDASHKKIGYGKILTPSDEIVMILDLKNTSLSFIVNNNDYGVAIDDIPSEKEYNIVVSLGDTGTSLTLL